MNYSDMNLNINTDYNTISILPGVEINVLKYLPIEEKNDIIYMALQEGEQGGLYNLLKIDMFFKLFIVYSYTDLEFTESEKMDPAFIYDELKSNGILDAIINSMDKEELKYLEDILSATLENKMKYRNTITSVINSFIENLPANATAAKNILEGFDPSQFAAIMDFVKAANADRPIN